MLLVETDRPARVRPRADQDRSIGKHPQLGEQLRSNTQLLTFGSNIRMPNQRNVSDRLKTHHARKVAALLESPEDHTFVLLPPKSPPLPNPPLHPISPNP